MDILRRASQGSGWPLSLEQLPALLDVVDEQTIPMEIQIEQDIGRLCLEPSTFRCLRRERRVVLQGLERCLHLDLESLTQAYIVVYKESSGRRFGVALRGGAAGSRLTLIGPPPDSGHASDVWQLLMDVLLLLPGSHTLSRAA
jgi:hypothetical protein